MARRRALRVGWPDVVGQILFVTLALPLLGGGGRPGSEPSRRRRTWTSPRTRASSGSTSVNGPDTVELLDRLRPAVIVVNGTRIIAKSVLDAIDCPIINTHAGITPRYRGVHGGYWALAEGRPDLVGTTVHLVDPGIDTGGVLVRSHFDVTPAGHHRHLSLPPSGRRPAGADRPGRSGAVRPSPRAPGRAGGRGGVPALLPSDALGLSASPGRRRGQVMPPTLSGGGLRSGAPAPRRPLRCPSRRSVGHRSPGADRPRADRSSRRGGAPWP